MLSEIIELMGEVYKGDSKREEVESLIDSALMEIYTDIGVRIEQVEEKQGKIEEILELSEQKYHIERELLAQGYESIESLERIPKYVKEGEEPQVTGLLQSVVESKNREIKELKEELESTAENLEVEVVKDANLNLRIKKIKENIESKEQELEKLEQRVWDLEAEIKKQEIVEQELEKQLNQGIEEYTERIQNLEIEIDSVSTPSRSVTVEIPEDYPQKYEGVEEETEIEDVFEGILHETDEEDEEVIKGILEELEEEETEEIKEEEIKEEEIEEEETEEEETEEEEIEEVKYYGIDVLEDTLPGSLTSVRYKTIKREVTLYRDIVKLFVGEKLRRLGSVREKEASKMEQLEEIFGLTSPEETAKGREGKLEEFAEKINKAVNDERRVRNRVIAGTTAEAVNENKGAPGGRALKVQDSCEFYIISSYNTRERRVVLEAILEQLGIDPEDVEIGLK